MSVLAHLFGTFLMFAGFLIILSGILLHRLTQQDLGRMFMSTTLMGGGEMPSGAFFRLIASIRGNEALKKQRALRLIVAGVAVSLVGALIG